MVALYEKSRAQEFGISLDQFCAILEDIQKKYLPLETPQEEKDRLYESLRLEELALARGCAAGNEAAWETFLLRYRAKLYDVAGYIAKESSAARELADSLYADLYGTNTRDGTRVSKLASYTGRGSLEGWLRTVMAQEYVNRYRRQRRLVSLDEESEEGVQFATPEPDTPSRRGFASGSGHGRSFERITFRRSLRTGLLLFGRPYVGRDCAYTRRARIND